MKRLTSIQLHNFAERLEREATKDWGGIPALWYGLIGREHYKQAVAEELRKLALERLKEERGYK